MSKETKDSTKANIKKDSFEVAFERAIDAILAAANIKKKESKKSYNT